MSAFKEITQILSEIKNPDDIEKFLNEIMTDNERKDLSLRWDLMRKLHDGIPQRAISAELGISLCKITKRSKILKSEDSIITKILKDKRK